MEGSVDVKSWLLMNTVRMTQIKLVGHVIINDYYREEDNHDSRDRWKTTPIHEGSSSHFKTNWCPVTN